MAIIRTITAGAVATAAFAVSAASASAGVPTGDFAPFKYCPYNNAAVTQCVSSVTSSGSIKLGNQNVPINKNLILQGGLIEDGTTTTWVDAVGAKTLSETPLDVPGGLIGIVATGPLSGPLLAAFYSAVSFANGVTATAELVGPVKFSLPAVLTAEGTAVELPVRVKLKNAFLGDKCYIGSAANPVRFKLTTGTTTPPAPANPLTGNPGTLAFNDDYTVINVAGLSLVDNAFAAPKAENCGLTILDRWLVTAAVNLKIGTPAAAGHNSAVFNGDSKLAGSDSVKASAGS